MKFEKLDVWKRASRLACNVYRLTKDCKDYGFKDQITRAGLSIPSNIAEGEERESQVESARFLYYSKGSAGELVTQLYIGIEIGYMDKVETRKLIQETKAIASMLASMIRLRKGYVKEIHQSYNIEEPRT